MQRADHYRKALAQLWLGQEMPTWGRPCRLRVTIASSSSGATEFAFDNGRILSMNMHIEGAPDHLIASVLPHEITHTVLAYSFRAPVPRWADEGAATLSEDTASRAHYDRAMAKVVRSGHLLPLRLLLPERNFPKDLMTFFAESYSLTNFLIAVGGREKFLHFVVQGEKEGWEKAAKSIYDCDSLDQLEHVWLGYVRMRSAAERSAKPSREAPATGSRRSKPAPALPLAAPRAALPPPPPARVGQIFLIGNTRTRDETILEQVPFMPGEILSYADLRIAEKNLARLKGLKSNPKVTVIDREGDGVYKDIQITVQEK